MTEMVTSGSMSGEEERWDGLLGESDNERRRSQEAPPVLYATALVLDSTSRVSSLVSQRHLRGRIALGGIDPDLRRHRRRGRGARGKPFGMGRVGRGEHGRARRDALLGPAVVHVGGRQQAEADVMVLGVVPGEVDVGGGPG